jgi:hypothetical protein
MAYIAKLWNVKTTVKRPKPIGRVYLPHRRMSLLNSPNTFCRCSLPYVSACSNCLLSHCFYIITTFP